MLTKKYLLGWIAVASLVIAFITLYKLVVNEFPSKSNLAVVYFTYAAALAIMLHAAAFWLNMELLQIRGSGLSKNAPRYLDYCITILVAAGLVQIYFSEDAMAKYITQIVGTKQEILANIKNKAKEHLENDCPTKSGFLVNVCKRIGMSNCEQNKGFTPGFCKTTEEIYKSPQLDSHIENKLSKNYEYLNHPIEFIVTQGGPQPIYSPIKKYVNHYISTNEYLSASQNTDSKLILNWISIVLLPIILSLRALKTSLEIFGKLS